MFTWGEWILLIGATGRDMLTVEALVAAEPSQCMCR